MRNTSAMVDMWVGQLHPAHGGTIYMYILTNAWEPGGAAFMWKSNIMEVPQFRNVCSSWILL